jgi:hypothetical protein
MAFVQPRLRARRSETLKRLIVNMSQRPSLTGCGLEKATALKLASEIFCQLQPGCWIWMVKRLGETPVDPSLLAFWQIGGDISPLVHLMRSSS